MFNTLVDQLKVKFFSSECIRSQNRLLRPNRFSHFRMSLTILREHSTLFAFCSGDNSCPSPKFDHSEPQANVKLSDDDVTSICFGKEENLFASSTKFVYEIDLKTYKLTGRYVSFAHRYLEGFSLDG